MNSLGNLVHKLSTYFISVACVTVGVIAIQSPARAASGEQHCVAEVGSATSPQGDAACFAKLSQAISYATGGAVKLPADATSLTKNQLQQMYTAPRAAVAETVVIGVSFLNRNFQGNTWTHTASAGCDSDVGREWYYQFNSAWNDKTSSADAAAGCKGWYWEAGNGTQGSGAFIGTGWSGGPMDDKATFVEWA